MFLPEQIEENQDGTLECTFWCLDCDKDYVVSKVPMEGFVSWINGKEFVQNCFPEMDKDERELFISGICPKCWNKMYPAGNPPDTGDEVEIEKAPISGKWLGHPSIVPQNILLGDN